MYPMYRNTYYQRLDVTNVIPDTGDRNLRYLGFFDELDSPFDRPRLREYVVQNQQLPVFRLYNDQISDEVMVIRFIINRCRLAQIPPPPEDVRRVARVARYHEADVS